jgi:hypothetical protein
VHRFDVAVEVLYGGSGGVSACGDQSDGTGSHQSKQFSSFHCGVSLFAERR